MKQPLSTGQAARLLGVTEPQIAETVRRGKVKPEPTVFAGRRLWARHHLLQAADALGIRTNDLAETLGLAKPEVSDAN